MFFCQQKIHHIIASPFTNSKRSALLLSYSLLVLSFSLATSLNRINTSQDTEDSLKESPLVWRCDTGSQKYFTINFAKIWIYTGTISVTFLQGTEEPFCKHIS